MVDRESGKKEDKNAIVMGLDKHRGHNVRREAGGTGKVGAIGGEEVGGIRGVREGEGGVAGIIEFGWKASVIGLDAEAGANDLAHGDGMVVVNAPAKGGGIGGGDWRAHDGDAFIERRGRGEANPTFLVGRVRDSHGGGIHHVEQTLGIGCKARGNSKLQGGILKGRGRREREGGGCRDRGGR